jgi:hypothetical protein
VTFAIHTPFRDKRWIELSAGTGLNVFRKQILPKRSINYKGRTITFDEAYLTDLAQAFTDRAFDQVAFQMAGDDGQHTIDPERFRGEVQAFEVTPDGLDAILKLTDEGAEVVRKNPKLGVSARIIEDVDRSDGKKWKHAIHHVLATIDPRVPALKPWEPIALSNSDLQLIDLSGESYEKKGATVPDDPKTPKLEDTQRAAFDLYMTELAALDPAKATDPAKPADPVTPTQAEIDAELDAFLKDALKDEPADASLSGDAVGIDLVNAELARQKTDLAETRAQLDLANFEREKADLLSQGIPPAMVDLAMPLLLGKEHTVDLSNGTKIDAGEITRKLLAEAKGTVDLSGEHPAAPGSPASDKTGSLLAAWENQNPSVITASGAYKS